MGVMTEGEFNWWEFLSALLGPVLPSQRSFRAQRSSSTCPVGDPSASPSVYESLSCLAHLRMRCLHYEEGDAAEVAGMTITAICQTRPLAQAYTDPSSPYVRRRVCLKMVTHSWKGFPGSKALAEVKVLIPLAYPARWQRLMAGKAQWA